jgi:hypothetical protein
MKLLLTLRRWFGAHCLNCGETVARCDCVHTTTA